MSFYRVACSPLERRRAELVKVAGKVELHAPELARVRSRRLARIVGGAAGVLGAAGLPITLFVDQARSPLPTEWLFGSVAAALGSWALTRAVLGTVSARALVARAVAGHDLASLDASNPWVRIAGSLSRMEAWSLALPLVAASLLGPLAMHGAVFSVMSAIDAAPFAKSFARWILLSSIIVGHAHLALAICTARYARRLACTETAELSSETLRRAWRSALLSVVVISSAPGILLLGIPPFLTLVTGLVLVPALYAVARAAIVHERSVLQRVEDDVAHVRVEIEDMEAARDALVAEPDDGACALPMQDRAATLAL